MGLLSFSKYMVLLAKGSEYVKHLCIFPQGKDTMQLNRAMQLCIMGCLAQGICQGLWLKRLLEEGYM